MVKIIDKIMDSDGPWYSLEFFPPRTNAGAANLIGRFDRMAQGSPLFVDITWGAGGGDPGGDHATSSMSISEAAQNYCGLDAMLHMTCAGRTKEDITSLLMKAKLLGIQNILALRGDAPPGEEWRTSEDSMNYAVDLVRHIRKEFGDWFGIAVAGYPGGHPDCVSYEDDIRYLKEKVDAGADFIVTQLFFQFETFRLFVQRCRDAGIKCPIIPGILPIQGFSSLRHIIKLSKLDIPDDIIRDIEPIKDDDEAVREYGVILATQLVRDCINSGVTPGVHFYTLNREIATTEIIQKVGLYKEYRDLPWRKSANYHRSCEDVRPIFWAQRPKSYIQRTAEWDDFPNGRWGDSSSPAFGDLKDYHLFHVQSDSKEAQKERQYLRSMWGEPVSEQDIRDVFMRYLKGDISELPWNDETLASETNELLDSLIEYNRHGMLTINSQPAVNGVPSTHPVYGWGGQHGYVYQKAYLEFFINVDVWNVLLEVLQSMTPRITFHAVDASGNINVTNQKGLSPVAVTWGVFPGKEIIQPTVVDPVSFLAWRDEAFTLWKSKWRSLYTENSPSASIIDKVADTYVLVNVVDNDYVNGHLNNVFKKFVDELHSLTWVVIDENIPNKS